MGSNNVTGGNYTSDDYVNYLYLYHHFTLQSRLSALETLAIDKKKNILDAGCGTGNMLPLIAERISSDGQLVGIDNSDIMLNAAQKLVDQHKLNNTKIIKADLLETLPFDNNTFDLIWTVDVLHPSKGFDQMKVLEEFKRVLRPGGVIAVFHTTWLRPMYLPGYSYLEQAMSRAREYMYYAEEGEKNIYWSGDKHPERAQGWLRNIGFRECQTSLHPSFWSQPLSNEVRQFVDMRINLIYKKAIEQYSDKVAFSDEDMIQWSKISSPESSEYILNQPDYYCAAYSMLAIGKK